MPIPILRLPFLALKCLLDCTDRLEIIKLSLCSKKADNALKLCGKNGYFFQTFSYHHDMSNADSLELCLLEMNRSGEHINPTFGAYVTIADRLSVFISANNYSYIHFTIYFECIGQIDKYNGKRRNLMIGENCVPLVIDEERGTTTFWNNKAYGMISIMEYFCVKYKSPIEELRIDGCKQSDYSANLKKVVDFMTSSKIEIETIFVGSDRIVSDEDSKYLLENVTVTGKFELYGHMRSKTGVKFDGKIKAESINVCGSLFTLQHLLNTDHGEITIESYGITNKDIHRFMELWVAGEFPNLYKFNLTIRKLNIKTALAGFTVRKYHEGVGKSIKGKNGAYAELNCEYGSFMFRVIERSEESEIEEIEDQDESEEDEDEEEESESDEDEEEEEEDSDN